MAKKKQHIDDFFKERLSSQELPLSGDEWTRLAKELQPAKKRKGFFWWIILGIGLLLAGWLLYKSLVTGSATAAKNEASETTSASEPFIPHNKEAADTSENKDFSSVGHIETPALSETAKNRSSVETKTPTANQHTYAPVLQAEEDNTAIQIITDVHAEPSQIYPSITALRLTFRSLDGFPYQINPREYSAISDSSKINVSKIKAGLGPVYGGIRINGLVGHQTISSAKDSLYARYRSENEQEGIGTQVQIQLHTSYKSFNLHAGLDYTQRTLSLGKPFNSHPELKILLYDSIPFVDLNLDTTWLPYNYRDSVIRSHEGKNLQHPSYTYIGIPLIISKVVELNTKWSIDLGLGLTPAVAIGAKGMVNSAHLRGLDNISLQEIKKLNLSGNVNAVLQYNLSPAVRLNLYTGIQQDILGISNLNGIKQRFTLYGTGIGFTYRLF